ncbi:MAG: hypothetical protein U0169_24925 [Polyangiaceae bacterium]
MRVHPVVRAVHRWTSVVFTLAVIANFVALGLGKQSNAIGFSALPPLFLLLFTGIYLFLVPYFRKGRGGESGAE